MHWTKRIPTIGGMPVTHILGVMSAKKKREKDDKKEESCEKKTVAILSEEEIKEKIDEN